MANLSLSEISRKGKEHRSELLINKIFKKEGEMNNFMTEEGLFHANKFFIDGKEYEYSKKLPDIIVGLNGTRSKIELEGKLSGSSKNIILKINQIEKTEDFGGQPSGGKRINKGVVFEDELFGRMVECVTSKCCKGKYSKEAEKILEATSKSAGSAVTKVEHAGGANTSRPIVLSGKNPIITPRLPEQHGEKLTDITLHHKNNKKTYLSLKFGSTLTFINSGVGTIFTEKDMKSGILNESSGKAILKAFGISNAKFCKVFNDYGKTGGKKSVDPHVEKVKLDKGTVKALLETAIGANYWMVHGFDNGNIYFWEVSKSRNNSYSTVSGEATVYYGGKQGRGKRIDVEFSNRFYDFSMNIRNKQSGIYPSHVMLDYESKPATGKELL